MSRSSFYPTPSSLVYDSRGSTGTGRRMRMPAPTRTRSDSSGSGEEYDPRVRAGAKRPSRQAALKPTPQQLPLPGEAYAPGCVFQPLIGRQHDRYGPTHPYKLCITKTQWKALWKKPYRMGKTQRIGCGVFACVWPRDRNTVVKITNDQSDVEALKRANAAGLHKEPYATVPKLYRAFRLKSPTTSRRPVYGMIVERLREESTLPRGATRPIYCLKDEATYDADPAYLNARPTAQ